MAQGIQENGWKIKFMASEYTHGLMEDATRGNGKRIIWKVWVYTNGTMGGHIKDSTLMIKNMAMVFIGGLMVANILVFGTLASNMN